MTTMTERPTEEREPRFSLASGEALDLSDCPDLAAATRKAWHWCHRNLSWDQGVPALDDTVQHYVQLFPERCPHANKEQREAFRRGIEQAQAEAVNRRDATLNPEE